MPLEDGREFVAENEFPRGHDQNPMSDGEVEAKFHRMAAPRIDEATRKQILGLCWKLEELNDVGEILRLFPRVA